MFSQGVDTVTLEDIFSRATEGELLYYYTGVDTVPCVINSPFRTDKRPSLGFHYKDGKLLWTDFSDGSGGDVMQFLQKLFGMTYRETLERVHRDLCGFRMSPQTKLKISTCTHNTSNITDIKVRTREWNSDDLDYWKEFGITLPWLQFADVYPISHIIFIKPDGNFCIMADKLSYAYFEFRDSIPSCKIYQPLNTVGRKWFNKSGKDRLSLWTKIPKTGDKVCICSSTKDALTLWSNTGIPCIALQGEAMGLSDDVVNDLRRRFVSVYILLDNDAPGRYNSSQLSQKTGFKEIILPSYLGAKDVSDMYKAMHDRKLFKQTILKLFNQ